MLKQKSMLGFFLEQQQKITHFQMNDCSLLEKKNLAENYYLRNKSKLNFELKLEQKFETHFLINQNKVNSLFVPHYILDPDFCKLYHTKYQEHNAIQKEDFYCLFTSPLHENWMDTISIKYENSMILRSGFFNQEYEIYDSILHGFDGMFIYCWNLDKYQLQLLTETAREFNFTLIFIIHNKKELNTILETDAPYIAISGFKSQNFGIDTTVFFQLANFIPKSANLMAWASKLENDKKSLLNSIGYKVIFEVC